jgi:hypothetical protein
MQIKRMVPLPKNYNAAPAPTPTLGGPVLWEEEGLIGFPGGCGIPSGILPGPARYYSRFACVCVCVCVAYMYIYTQLCVCVCVSRWKGLIELTCFHL